MSKRKINPLRLTSEKIVFCVVYVPEDNALKISRTKVVDHDPWETIPLIKAWIDPPTPFPMQESLLKKLIDSGLLQCFRSLKAAKKAVKITINKPQYNDIQMVVLG